MEAYRGFFGVGRDMEQPVQLAMRCICCVQFVSGQKAEQSERGSLSKLV